MAHSPRRRAAPRSRKPRVETLEDRRLLAVFSVDSTADSGPGSLREAVAQANALPGPDEVVFAASLGGQVIELEIALDIDDDLALRADAAPGGVTLDGGGQTGLLYIHSDAAVQAAGMTFTGSNRSVSAVRVDGEFTAEDCSFVDNQDVPIYNSGVLVLRRCFFSGNEDTDALALENVGFATIEDTTFAENGSPVPGVPALGAHVPVIEHLTSAPESLRLIRSTVGGYAHPVGQGGYGRSIVTYSFAGPDNVLIEDSIVVGDIDGAVVANHSLLASVDPAAVSGVGSVLNVNPRLGPLALQGGPTPTYAPLPGSPALDAGDPSFVAAAGQTDQRGGPYARAVGRLDMGAHESQASPAATPGDFNADGRVDAADYTLWRDNLGGAVAPLASADATGDGLVDRHDYNAWRAHYGFVSIGDALIVNDLGDDDDRDINNGRTTLREAINFAREVSWFDTITFDPALSGGVIQVGQAAATDPLGRPYYQIEQALTIDATMLPDGLTLDAGGRTFGFHIHAYVVDTPDDFDVTLAGLTIANGFGGFGSRGGGAVNSWTTGVLTLIDCELIDSNGLVGLGGAIHAGGDLYLIDTDVRGASWTGGFAPANGGVYAVGDISLTRSSVEDVQGPASRAKGIYTASGAITLEDSSVTNTDGTGVETMGDVTLLRSHITAARDAGLVARDVTLVDSSVSDNSTVDGRSIGTVGRSGGGIHAGGDVSLTRSQVDRNQVTEDSPNNHGGGIYAFGAVVAVDSSVNGNAASVGGGIYAEANSESSPPAPGDIGVTLTGTEVSGNSAYRGGAAVHSLASIELTGSTFNLNQLSGQYGGADDNNGVVVIGRYESGFAITATESVFQENTVDIGETQAVLNAQVVGDVTISGVQILDNDVTGVMGDTVHATDSVIARNGGVGVVSEHAAFFGSTISANSNGGATAWRTSGTLRLTDSSVIGNTAVDSFASAGVTAAYVLVERSLIADNHATYTFEPSASNLVAGGVAGAGVAIVDSTVHGNSISGPGVRGGGVSAIQLYVYGSTISGNTAAGDGAQGGGVYSNLVRSLRQSTISGNRVEGADAQGGGLWSDRVVDAAHITIAGNTSAGANAEGGGLWTDQIDAMVGAVIANNTDVAGAPDLRAISVDETAEALGVAYSLIGDPSGSPLATGGGGPGNLLGVDPLLGPLADNGGPTQTHLPQAGSPLIDAGDPTLSTVPARPAGWPFFPTPNLGEHDQRGEPYARLVDSGAGRIDIGAVEVQPPPSPSALDAAFEQEFAETTARPRKTLVSR